MVDAAGGLSALPRRPAAAAATPDTSPDIAVSRFSPAWLPAYADFLRKAPHGAAQEPVWLAAWHTHSSKDMIAAAATAKGKPVLMLALEVVRRGPFRVARFVGGSHANANFPAVDPAWATGAARRDVQALALAVRRARPDIDLVLFERMPAEHAGTANPLLAAGGAPSPNPALSLTLEADILRTLDRRGERRKAKKQRSKIRKFEAAGGFRRIEAQSDAEVERLLGAFFAFKESRFRQAGIADVFAEPSVRAAFLTLFRAALREPHRPFVLHGLEVGGALRAVTGSSRTPRRTTCEFGGISDDELGKQSPGEFLFYQNIEEACAAGQDAYDFGVGDEPYKRHWCDTETTHFDVELPLTLKGRALAGGLGLLRRATGTVKRNPVLWQAVKRLRRRAAGAEAAENAEP